MRFFWRKHIVKNAEVVYELKRGGCYVVEFSRDAMTKDMVTRLSKALRKEDITCFFVPNPTNHRMFEPMPATVQAKTKRQR